MKQIIALVLLCGMSWSALARASEGVQLIETKPFRILQGVVYDGAAKPLSGARVEVFTHPNLTAPAEENAEPLAVQWTTAEGAFNFNALPAGSYEICATVPGGAWQTTCLRLKIQPDNPHAKTRLIALPLTLADAPTS